jgi:hypothetical protein
MSPSSLPFYSHIHTNRTTFLLYLPKPYFRGITKVSFLLDNNSRIPSKKQLTPFAFTAFIIRTFYPKVWKKYVEEGLHEPHLEKFKNRLFDLPEEKWDPLQETFFYLG